MSGQRPGSSRSLCPYKYPSLGGEGGTIVLKGLERKG